MLKNLHSKCEKCNFDPIFQPRKIFQKKKFFEVSARSQRVLTLCEENFQNFGDTDENELVQISSKFIKIPFFLFSKFIKIDLKFMLMWTGRISERGGISEMAHTNRPNLSWKKWPKQDGQMNDFSQQMTKVGKANATTFINFIHLPVLFWSFFQLKLGRFVWAISEIPPNFRFT